MLGEATVTFTGNVGAVPELRFTKSGHPVAGFSVAVAGREKSPAGAWQDARVTFFRCSAWFDLAEPVAAALSKGDRVTVIGTISARQYETAEGEKRTSWDVDVSEVAPSMRFADVTVTRRPRAVPVQRATEANPLALV